MKFANNANTTLASSLTAIATSMSVTSAAKFPVLNPLAPVPEYFYCTLTDVATQTVIEIVKVTVTSGTTWTIVRGQDGTTGTAFAAGDVVSLRLVKASLDLFPKLDETNTFTGTNTFNTSIAATSGGTGQSTVTTGDLLYGSATNTWSKLADVATGNALISGGVGVAPAWGKVGLATHVSGTLPTANGGTGLTSFTSGGVAYASSTSALTTGSALYFDGTNLGLGTATPGGTLDISSTHGTSPTNGSNAVKIYSSTTAGVGVGPSIFFGGQTGNSTAKYGFAGIQGFKSSAAANNYSGALAFFTQSSGGATALTEQMRIHSSGGVSIGNTTDPGATNLSVTGEINGATLFGQGISIGNGASQTVTCPRSFNTRGAQIFIGGVVQGVGGRAGLYITTGYGNGVTTISAFAGLTVTCATNAGTITIANASGATVDGRITVTY